MFPILSRSFLNQWREPFGFFDREMNRALSRSERDETEDDGWVAAYPVDISEDKGSIYVDAEMPGFKKEEIDVSVGNGMLSISAERKPEPSNGQKHVSERRYLKIARSFTLPADIDESKVDAKLENGVLKVHLTKTGQSALKRVAVH
jgi:HSP20 family protein